jgi:hypothetical protein
MFEKLQCFLRREHNYKLRGRDGRVFLECNRCGVLSPGLELETRTRSVSSAKMSLRLLFDESVVAQFIPKNKFRPTTKEFSQIKGSEQTLRLYFD